MKKPRPISKKAVLAAVKAKGAVAFTVIEGEVVVVNSAYLWDLLKKASKNKA